MPSRADISVVGSGVSEASDSASELLLCDRSYVGCGVGGADDEDEEFCWSVSETTVGADGVGGRVNGERMNGEASDDGADVIGRV
jgi:hypothetical protein